VGECSVNDFTTDRLDPTSRLEQSQPQQPWREQERRERRRPQPESKKSEAAESSDEPPHQLDRLA
jgi:hypothetical protein